MTERSPSVEEATNHALAHDEGSGSLLGLETTGIENTGQNLASHEDSNQSPAPKPRLAPLLGTISRS